MSLRVGGGVGVVALLVVAAAGCGGDAPTSAAPAPAAPTAPIVTAPGPTGSSVPAPPPRAPSEQAPEAAPPVALPVLGGDVMWLREDGVLRPTLLLRRPDRPRPAGPVIARAAIHHGVMDVRLLEVTSSPYATAEIFDLDETCTARVVRARELHTIARPHGDDDPASQNQVTYLGLELDGCERGMGGVVGTSVAVRALHEIPDARTEPAPPELVAVVQQHDDGLGDGEPRDASTYRLIALPERDLRIVIGSGAWVLGQGTHGIGPDSMNGMVIGVVEAGWRTFFFVATPSEGWLEPLEQIVPEIRPSTCVVADASGTPLNVRRLPRSSAEVVATLANDTTIDALVGPSAWARVATTPAGWAHTSGLRCTALPPEPWP